MPEEVKFNIHRFDPDKDKEAITKEYTVPLKEGMTVLDGLEHIQKNIDKTLSYKSSCRAGKCQSCAMVINGSQALACQTVVKDKVITLKPLPGMKLVKDLVVTPSKDIKFKVFRFDPDTDKQPYFKEYTVPVTFGMTVLEGLSYIQEYLDGSLVFRSSCRAGVCGSCGMHINGKYRLSCETQILALEADVITVKPIAHMKILKDLIVDLEPFWAKYRSIKPYLIPGDPNPEIERIQTQDDREDLVGMIDCILCGCCQGACTMTGTDEEYLGPAILFKADRFVRDSRDKALKERINLVGGDHGVWRCHTIYNCQVACPKQLDPTGAIADLKRKSIDRGTRISFWGRI